MLPDMDLLRVEAHENPRDMRTGSVFYMKLNFWVIENQIALGRKSWWALIHGRKEDPSKIKWSSVTGWIKLLHSLLLSYIYFLISQELKRKFYPMLYIMGAPTWVGHLYTHGQFMLMYGKNHHNIEKWFFKIKIKLKLKFNYFLKGGMCCQKDIQRPIYEFGLPMCSHKMYKLIQVSLDQIILIHDDKWFCCCCCCRIKEK